MKLERLAKKSAQNLLDAIVKSKKAGLARLVYGLGIRHTGQSAALILAQTFLSMENLQKASFEDLESVMEIGPRIASSLREFLARRLNLEEINRLKKKGVVMLVGKKKKGSSLRGKQFVLTGSLERFTRNQAKEKILTFGGRVTSSVSGKTDYVVVGSDPGSKLSQAKKLGVNILNETEFEELLG